MKAHIINMQHFADPGADGNADTVLNSTLGHIVNSVIPDTNALSFEMKTFYDKSLITLAGPNLVHDQFGQKKPIPRNGGKTIEFRKFSKLPKALTPITEGITPVGNKLHGEAITATVDQYGDYIEQTDLLQLSAIDNTIVEATRELAEQAGLTIDTVVRNELNAGTNVFYVPKVSSGTETEITSRADITVDSQLRVKDVFRAAAILKAVNAPKINGAYVAIIHPYVAYGLMQEAGDKWMDIQKYTSNVSKIYQGEVGMIGGVRFVESTEAKIFAPAEISDGMNKLTVKTAISESSTSVVINETLTAAASADIPVYIDGVANKITKIETSGTTTTLTVETAITSLAAGKTIVGTGAGKDGTSVYSTIFLAQNAYGTTELTGGGLEHIVKQLGYGNDPLNQRSSIGWKATKVAKRLVEEYILRVESAVEDFPDAEEN